MNVRMLIELTAVGMQGYKQAYFDIELFGPFQQGIVGTGEEYIEQGPVVGKGGPEFIGHREGDALPFAVRQDVLLLAIHCSVAFMPQALQPLRLQLWQTYLV